MLRASCLGLVLASGWVGLPLDKVQAQTPHVPHSPQWFSGTYLDPAIARQDILPHAIVSRIPEHRQVYNRPKYYPGKIAHAIEPSSQEAWGWYVNRVNGNYRKHAGRCVATYYYPKPWEVLNTAPRPDTRRLEGLIPSEDVPPVIEAELPELR